MTLDVMEFMRRFPQHVLRTLEERIGDIRAQIAANNVGVRGLQLLCHKYGWQTVNAAMAAYLDHTEAAPCPLR